MKRARKGRWLRIMLRLIIAIIVLFITACFVFDRFVQFRMSDEQLTRLFDDHDIDGRIGYYTAGGRQIRYVSIGHDSLPALFMLHGSPSSLSIYRHYFTDSLFLRRFRMVAVDRPGYGNSGFGIPEPSIKKQADALWPLLSSLQGKEKTVLIVAGSYGTSVACRLMMDHPDAADGALLIAPSLAPGEEKTYWFTTLIEHPLLRWFIPRMFRSANTEKIHHEAGLTEMLPYWHKIKSPVYYLQGANDQLIYTTNALFAQKHLVSAPYLNIEFLKDRPHFFAFSDRMIIRQKILDLHNYVINEKTSERNVAL